MSGSRTKIFNTVNGHVAESDAVQITAIAAMGMTGSGKNDFIKHATQSAKVKVGHHLTSCTENVEEHEFLLGGHQVVLFDTLALMMLRGFDADILAELAQKLSAMYKNNLKLAGIIYVHKITDTRVTRTVKRNLSVLMDLCGDDPLKNLTLLASFWDETDRVCEQKEKELVGNHDLWGYTVDNGAEIQTEMVKEGRDVKDTRARVTLEAEVAQLLKQYEKELDDVEEKTEKARRGQKLELEEMLAVERREKERDLRKMQDEQATLERDRSAEIRCMEQEFQDWLLRLVEDRKERDTQLNSLGEQLTAEGADADRCIQDVIDSSEANLRMIVSNMDNERVDDQEEHMQQLMLYEQERDDAVAQYEELELTNLKFQQMAGQQQSVNVDEPRRLQEQMGQMKRKIQRRTAMWAKIGGAALCTVLAPLPAGMSILFIPAFSRSEDACGEY